VLLNFLYKYSSCRQVLDITLISYSFHETIQYCQQFYQTLEHKHVIDYKVQNTIVEASSRMHTFDCGKPAAANRKGKKYGSAQPDHKIY
jgi:hypothetical protein